MNNFNENIALVFKHNFESVYLKSINLVKSYKKIKKLYPFDGEKFDISDDEKELLDAFIFRFGKLQDMIGSKIFKGVLLMEKEEIGTMRDTLNKMEKINILDSVDEWQKMRVIRDSITHDYENDKRKLASELNQIIDLTPELIEVVKKVYKHVECNIGFDTNDYYAFSMNEIEI